MLTAVCEQRGGQWFSLCMGVPSYAILACACASESVRAVMQTVPLLAANGATVHVVATHTQQRVAGMRGRTWERDQQPQRPVVQLAQA